jgi:hypothetical protein
MHVLINTPHSVLPTAKAIEIVDKLNSDELDDWHYLVNRNPNPDRDTAIIEIYDENWEFVSYL